jgi:hypothetical protein
MELKDWRKKSGTLPEFGEQVSTFFGFEAQAT